MKYARSENNVVVQVIGNEPTNLFAPQYAALFRVCGDAVQAGWLDDATTFTAPLAPDLAVVKADRWEAIKTIRDRKVQSGGYKVNVATVDKWFHSDTFSRTQQMGLVMFGASCPPVPWKTMDGTSVTMSPTLAGQIFTAGAGQDQLLFGKAEALKALVYASNDPANVDIKTGWPATFGGV